MTLVKLSPAQIALLEAKEGSCVSKYKPCLKLRDLGLVTVVPGAYDNITWKITPAGEQYLMAQSFPQRPLAAPEIRFDEAFAASLAANVQYADALTKHITGNNPNRRAAAIQTLQALALLDLDTVQGLLAWAKQQQY